MDKRSIGDFLAVLRKSNGMTQQDVADRLNVSNKTISKWECDESAPDIGLIPVIAELFQVTCDEILLGRRISSDESPKNTGVKVDKQVKRLIGSTMTRFSNATLISMAIVAVGTILGFLLAFVYAEPYFGFGLEIIFCMASMIWTITHRNTVRLVLDAQELGESGMEQIAAAKVKMFRRFFTVVWLNVMALVLSLPLVYYHTGFFADADCWERYCADFSMLLLFFLILLAVGVWLARKRLDIQTKPWLHQKIEKGRKMNIIQAVLLVLAFVASVLNRYVLNSVSTNDPQSLQTLAQFVMLSIDVFTACAIAVPLWFAIKTKNRGQSQLMIAMGARNLLLELGMSAVFTSFIMSTVTALGTDHSVRYFYMIPNPLSGFYVLGILGAVFAAYFGYKYYWVKRTGAPPVS